MDGLLFFQRAESEYTIKKSVSISNKFSVLKMKKTFKHIQFTQLYHQSIKRDVSFCLLLELCQLHTFETRIN